MGWTLAFCLAPGAAVVPATAEPPGRVAPEEVVTAESCGECHASELVVWKKTPHATGFKTLHRKESAAAIAERMGIKLIKRQSLCLDCHYTPVVQSGSPRATSGVSCESCHGSGRDWIDVHNEYGGKGIDHTTETAEHRRQRIEASRAAGMRRPSDVYPVVASCFGCHTVPNEDLVNIGKHSLGSSGFELVQRVEEIRHNFLDSFLTGDGSENAEPSETHKRRMYVVGRALDLEYSLRGLATATKKGVFFKAMQRRLRSAVSEARVIAKVTDMPEALEMIDIARGVKAQLGKKDELLAAADRIGRLNRRFIAEYDEAALRGPNLAAVDRLIAGEEIELDPEPVEPDDTAVVVADGGTATDPTPGAAPAASTDAPSAGSRAVGSRVEVIPAVEAEGRRRAHLRPRSQFDTLAASSCQKCHGDQNAWWFDDPHYAAADPFLDRGSQTSKIARLYGVKPDRMARGDSLCMDCHGTIATARNSREVQDGVSCQSCHGPAASYLEPHQEGEKSEGRNRPGFKKALQLGMKDLQDLSTRLSNCASCHYITDPRLISAGHPTGADFDIVQGMAQVKHWQRALESDQTLRDAYRAVQGRRGPIPQVRLARLAQRVVIGTDGSVKPDPAQAAPARSRRAEVRAPRPVSRRSGRSAAPATGEAASVGLPELPEALEETALEELLRVVQERIELLYERMGKTRVHGGRQGDGS